MTSRRTRLGLLGAAIVWLGGVGIAGGAHAAGSAAQSTPAAPAAMGNVENGKVLHVKYGCYTCHGYVGQGGPGVRLAPGTIALPAFTRYVRRPTGVMPPFTEKVITDQELADIRAYLEALPDPPDLATIPLLQGLED